MKLPHPLAQQFNQQIRTLAYEKAVMTANELSQIQPQKAEPYYMMGYALKQCQQYLSALKCFDLALSIEPNQARIHIEKGEVQCLLGQQPQAFEAYYQAMQLEPENTVVLQKTGGFLLDSGHFGEAKTVLNQAISLGNKDALNELLDLYEREGDQDALEAFLAEHREFFAQDPNNLTLANVYLTLKKYQQAVFYLNKMYIERKPSPWLRAYYNLSAQAYESMNLFDQAFAMYQKQNDVTSLSYSKTGAEELFQQSVNISDTIRMAEKMETVANRTRWSPLFIIGLPRTGSTLLEQILSTNHQLTAAGELTFIETAYNDYVSKKKSLSEVSRWFQQKIEFIIQEKGYTSDKPLWVSDKMPTNFVYVGFIKAMLPEAKFLYCKRQAMDVGLSLYKQNFNQAYDYANDFSNIAHFMALEKNIMRRWFDEFESSLLTVEYEKLVTNFNAETKKVFEFLGLKWTKNTNLFYKNKRFAKTASYKQVREPISTDAIAQFLNYEPYLNELNQQLTHYGLIEKEAMPESAQKKRRA